MNGLDGIFILTILLLAFWGFQVGVLGTAIWLVAAYGAIVLGAQLVGRVVPLLGLPPNYTSIATTVGYIVVSTLVGILARSVSSSVRAVINVTPLKWINDIGGALLGGVVGLVLVTAVIAVAAAFTYVVPEGALEYGGSVILGVVFADLSLRCTEVVVGRTVDGLVGSRDYFGTAWDHRAVCAE